MHGQGNLKKMVNKCYSSDFPNSLNVNVVKMKVPKNVCKKESTGEVTGLLLGEL